MHRERVLEVYTGLSEEKRDQLLERFLSFHQHDSLKKPAALKQAHSSARAMHVGLSARMANMHTIATPRC